MMEAMKSLMENTMWLLGTLRKERQCQVNTGTYKTVTGSVENCEAQEKIGNY
jgi:hypothetical protein